MEQRTIRPRPAAFCVAALLALAGLLLPVAASAKFLAARTGVAAELLEHGVWTWKLAVLALAALLLAADVFRARDAAAPALLVRGRSSAPPPGRRATLFALALCGAGAALRFHELGAGLSFDEIDTLVRYAKGDPLRALASFETQNNHLGYSLLANLSVHAFGASAWALRLPAVLLGAASLWASWRFALLVAPRAEALFATALLAFSWHHVWFSQDARGYTGIFLAALLSTGVFLSMLWQERASGLKLPLLYAFAASFAVWMHVTAVFVVVAHFFVWLVLVLRRKDAGANRWQPLWGFVLAGALSLCLYALVLPQLASTLGGPSMPGRETQWRNPLWLVRETLAGLTAGVPGGGLAIAEAVFVVGLGLWSYARQGAALFATFVLPAALTLAALVFLHHNLWPRFFFFSGGFAVLVLARGVYEFVSLCARGPLASLRNAISATAAVLLSLANAATLPRAFGPKQDFGAAAAYVLEHAPAGAVATLEMGALPFVEYRELAWTRIGSVEELLEFERRHPETWVVLAVPKHVAAAQPRTWERLSSSEYRDEKAFYGTLRDGEILVKVRPAPGRDQ